MIADSLNSIKAFLYDRTVSPLFGALITAYLIWNFKILMLATSKDSYAVKEWEFNNFYSQPFFEYIPFYGYTELPWLTNYVMCLFVMPVISALIYIYVFPFPAKWVFTFSYNKQVELQNKKKELQGSALITAEEKAEILSQYDRAKIQQKEQELSHRKSVDEFERQIDQLIEDKSELEEKISRYDSSVEAIENYERLKQELEEIQLENTQLSADNELYDRKLKSYEVEIEQLKGNLSSSEQEAPLLKTSTEMPHAPYLKFYERMSESDKYDTAKALGLLLRKSFEISEFEFEMWGEPNVESQLIDHLKLYGILDMDNTDGFATVVELTETGKSLYRYILENEPMRLVS